MGERTILAVRDDPNPPRFGNFEDLALKAWTNASADFQRNPACLQRNK